MGTGGSARFSSEIILSGFIPKKYIRIYEIQRGKDLIERNLRIAILYLYFQTNKYEKMKLDLFDQVPKFADEKYWAEDGVHTGAHGVALMASYLAQSVLPEKTPLKNKKM